jgi:hypothetical protein
MPGVLAVPWCGVGVVLERTRFMDSLMSHPPLSSYFFGASVELGISFHWTSVLSFYALTVAHSGQY